MRLALLVAVLAGCYQGVAPLGAPCGPGGVCPSGQSCDEIRGVCVRPGSESEPDAQIEPDSSDAAEPIARTWRDDSAADFANGTLFAAIVEPGGFVGPQPYATGRLRLTGLVGNRIGDPATATWASVVTGATTTGRTLATAFDLEYSTARPWGVGPSTADDVTILVEGELELDASGSWLLELEADDVGFVDVAAPGLDFVRLASTVNAVTGIVTASYMVTTPGWYRVRAAVADMAGNMEIELRADPPNVAGGIRDISSDRLRARVDDLQGFVVDAFDDVALVDYFGTSIESQPLVRVLGVDPYDVSIGTLTYTLRWSGQILIDVAGSYAFRLDTFQGHRMWLDGTLIADSLTTSAQVTTTPATSLAAGWHDVVVDVHKSNTNTPASVSLTVASGPAFVGMPIPADHVRPVVGRGSRWLALRNSANVAIPDGGSSARTLTAILPTTFVPISIQAAYELDHTVQSSVSVVLDPPAGANITLLAANGATGTGVRYAQAAVPMTSAGASWLFTASDTVVDATTGMFLYAGVTQLYRGGIAPFPTTLRYESEATDLGAIVALGAATWGLRQGLAATVQMRSCLDASTCAAEAWVDVTSGAVPAIEARRFVQYAVSITTDGDTPTALDWFELAYAASPQ